MDPRIYQLGIPILGICYGCQLIAYDLGGDVTHAETREYGKSDISYGGSALFAGMQPQNVCWMSHTDYVSRVPAGFTVTATTKTCPAAAFEDVSRKIYGIQFHAEVHHTMEGDKILHNFLYSVCGAKGDWTMSGFVTEQVECSKQNLPAKGVVRDERRRRQRRRRSARAPCAGDNLICVFVDHGLLRKGEAEEVVSVFRDGLGMT